MTDKWQDADWNLFALGALDENTQREMQEHLQTRCHACSRSYQEAVLVMDALAATVPQQKPSPHIADALLSRITQANPVLSPVKVSQRRSFALPWVAAAACALLAVWFGIRLEQRESSCFLTSAHRCLRPARNHQPHPLPARRRRFRISSRQLRPAR